MKLHSARFQRRAAAVAVGMLIASVAYAQSSEGSINGRGKPGEKVTITSTENGSTRQITVDSSGAFNANKLPPGSYTVTSGGVKRDVNVAIGSGTTVDFSAPDVARVVVRGVRSTIDVASVESNTVFTADQMAALPVARDVNMIAQLAPGVVRGDADLGAGNLPSFSGASVAENAYYINGFDVTNIRNFLSYANLPFDAIGAQQMKSGGYSAEYGRALGGVISLVTKRGTNTWKAGGAVFYEPQALRSSGKNVADLNPNPATGKLTGNYTVFGAPRKERDLSYDVFAGGPIIQDKLFFFGLLEGRNDTVDSFSQNGSLRTLSRTPNGTIKIDFTPNDMHRLELTAISNKKDLEITDWHQDLTVHPEDANLTYHKGSPAYSTQTEGGNVLIGKYTGYLTDSLTVSALVGKVNQKQPKIEGARNAGLDCPVILDTNTAEIGCWAKPFPGPAVRALNAPDDEDKRKAYRFDVDYVLGSHTLRGGIDHQKFNSVQAGSSTYSGGYYYRYFVSPTGTVNGVPNAVAPGGQYVRRRESVTTGGSFEVDNRAFYVEDNWKIVKDVLLYAGLRSESFNNRNADGISFVKADNLLAPRLGFSWDVQGDSSLKVFGNAGRYYIPVASNTNIRATQGELFEQRFYTFTGRDPRTQAPLGMSATDIGKPQIVSDGSLANPATIADMNMKPMSQDEYILGFQRALAAHWTVGLKGTYRKIQNGMDDYCSHVGFERWAADNGYKNFDSSTMAQCMLLNPGNDITLMMDLNNDGKLQKALIPNSYLGLAKYTRVYKALELTAERPWDGTWSLYGSYVWSKLRGTAEGYVNSVINQEDAGVTQDFDFAALTDGADGYLSNDRRHVFKLYGNYGVTSEWRLGFNASLASGRPTSCIGFVPAWARDAADAAGYTTASSYYCLNANGKSELHNRGTAGRTPWTSMLDLQVAYMPQVAKGKLTIQADIFNVFNRQQVTEWNEQRDYSRDTVAIGTLNQNYQQPTSFQTPRSVRLTARYEF